MVTSSDNTGSLLSRAAFSLTVKSDREGGETEAYMCGILQFAAVWISYIVHNNACTLVETHTNGEKEMHPHNT